jgi:hypothetical protein
LEGKGSDALKFQGSNTLENHMFERKGFDALKLDKRIQHPQRSQGWEEMDSTPLNSKKKRSNTLKYHMFE